jgi:hypothetical protein
MKAIDQRPSTSLLGKASQATRGAGGHMLEAGGLWTKAGIGRGR